MSLDDQVAALTAATTNLLNTVTVSKATLDQAVADAAESAELAVASLKSRRHDWVAPYTYCGTAPGGTAESSALWTIKRIQINSDGSTTTLTATSVAWTDRLTSTYS